MCRILAVARAVFSAPVVRVLTPNPLRQRTPEHLITWRACPGAAVRGCNCGRAVPDRSTPSCREDIWSRSFRWRQIRQQIRGGLRIEPRHDGRLRMNGTAVVAFVQAGEVRGDWPKFSGSERRITTQEHFVIFQQRPRGSGKNLEYLQQTRLGFQRSEITHRGNRSDAKAATEFPFRKLLCRRSPSAGSRCGPGDQSQR